MISSTTRINLIILHLVVISIFLFVLRTSIPIFKYIFIIIYLPISIYILINNWSIYKKLKYKNFRSFLWLLVPFVVLVLSFILSQKSYIVVFKDIVNAFIVFTFFFMLIPKCIEHGSVDKIYTTFLKYIIIFSVIICIKDIVVFYYSIQVPYGEVADLERKMGISSLYQTDYNFSVLPLLFSIVIILSYSTINRKFLSNFISVSNLVLVVFTIDIFLSNSRRGLILYMVLITLLIVINLLPISRLKALVPFEKRIRTNSKVYFTYLLILFLIGTTFISFASFQQKNRLLSLAGLNTTMQTKYNISTIFFRYYKTFNSKYTLEDFNDKLWSIRLDPENPEIPKGFDPRNPDSGWGRRKHITVETNFGENSSILPKGAKGYLLDSTTNINYWQGGAYSKTRINNVLVQPGDTIILSSYCYVSEDFNGTYAAVYINGGETAWTQKIYNNEKKGSWQYLYLKHTIEKHDTIGCYLFWTKHYYPDRDSLNILGYVVFAYPQIDLIKGDFADENKCDTISCSKRLEIIDLNRLANSKKVYKSSIVSSHFMQYYKALVPRLLHVTILSNDSLENDPIRKLINTLIGNDTTFISPSIELEITHAKNEFIGTRTDRWKLALLIFTKEYTPLQKLFGGGFKHLNWFGLYFNNDPQSIDYPHNPFLSILLYSGIVGLMLYCLLLYRVLIIYLNNTKYVIFAILTAFALFFTFFSSSTPFDPPIMCFIITLPYFLDSMNKILKIN